jgi:ABC-type nitrate/sulfonate/bicarbonate transport system ATPase subunit
MNYRLEETILYLDNVELGYGEGSDYKAVLKNINMVEKNVVRDGYDSTGQIIAILGRSGRGKSTLFKALTGLKTPKSGQVLITELSSENVDDARIVREGDIGFVDQKYTLFRHKTVEQIFKYALRKSKLTKEQKTETINKYLNDWGLEKHKNKYSCELSGGQRQRTAIIEQILSSGHFMVLDEPFSGLDVGNIRDVKRSFDMIQKNHELNTILFSTHELRLAVELADSIYVVGFPDETQEFSTIVKHFDLKQMGLAWQPWSQQHTDLVEEIDKTMMAS